MRDPGDDVGTEWDPSMEQHSYYHLNPSENVSYRYSYDTGEMNIYILDPNNYTPFVGWLPDGGRSFKWEERSVQGDVRGEYGWVIDQSEAFIIALDQSGGWSREREWQG